VIVAFVLIQSFVVRAAKMTIIRAISTLLVLWLAIGDAWSASPPFEVSLKRRDLNLTWLSSERTKRSQNITMPIGGSIGTIGLYFTEITVGGQVFRVSIVRIWVYIISPVYLLTWIHDCNAFVGDSILLVFLPCFVCRTQEARPCLSLPKDVLLYVLFIHFFEQDPPSTDLFATV
jgi:hypothetical protein